MGGPLYENVNVVDNDVTSPQLAAAFMGLSPESLEDAGISSEDWAQAYQDLV